MKNKKGYFLNRECPSRARILLKNTFQVSCFGVSLLIIDPIVSAVAGDMHRANDVRRSLQAVVDFAEVHACAVIGITHFAKGGAGKSPRPSLDVLQPDVARV